MYENLKKPLLPKGEYLKRVLLNLSVAFGLIAIALGIGVIGYHVICKLGWVDSLLNASMILGGMGPVDPIPNTAGKLFASFYAIFSGIAFLSIIAVILAPVVHRFLHKFHLDNENDKD